MRSFENPILLIFLLIGFVFISKTSKAQVGEYDLLKSKYDRLKSEKKLDSALFVAKQINQWTYINEGDTSLRYAVSFRYIGIIFRINNEIDSALIFYKKSLEILEFQNRKNHQEYGNGLFNLGVLYKSSENFNFALKSYIQAKDIFEKNTTKDIKSYAACLNNLGDLYRELEEYKAAEKILILSTEIYLNENGDKDYYYALSLGNLGLLYDDMGDYAKSELFLLKSTEIFKKTKGESNKDYIRSLSNLGNLYCEQNDFVQAKKFYEQSLEKTRLTFGENNDLYISSLNNIGVMHKEAGDIKNAEFYYLQCLEIIKSLKGIENLSYVAILNNLGIFYNGIGDYSKALKFHDQALTLREKLLGRTSSSYASSLINLGAIYLNIGDFKSAENSFLNALGIFKKDFGNFHPHIASCFNSLGNLYQEIGNYKKSEYYYKQSLKINKKFTGDTNLDYASNLNNLGALYLRSGKYKAAEKQLIECLKIRKNKLGEEHELVAGCLYNLGSLYFEMEAFKKAEYFKKLALKTNKKQLQLNFIFLSYSEKYNLWKKEQKSYNALNLFSLISYNSVPSSSELSFSVNLISKSLLLETSNELDKILNQSSDEQLKLQFSEMKQLRRLVTKMQSEGSDKKEIIERYNQQADSLDKILVNKVGEYANAKRKFEITWKDVQTSLLFTEAAIEFAKYYDYNDSTNKYMALLVRPGYEYPKLVKLGSELNIKNACSQKEFSDLYNYVWRGVDSLLTGVKTIYYSPVGELNNVPFSALINDNNYQSDSSKSNWSYLIDRYDLHQVTTTRYLADGTLKENESIPLSINLIGGVNYSDLPLSKDSIEINETTEDLALQINLQNELNDSKTNRGGKLGYLKGSEIEVKQITKVLQDAGWLTTTISGRNAGEYQFKDELNLKSPGIIHIATHGFAFPEKEIKEEKNFQVQEKSNYKISEDPMVRCGLMFSGANISWSGDSKKMIETTGDDGILTAAEVANMDLSNTKLVVLSACETGLGKIESSEGTFGLKRGFKLAGVDQIIVSLWNVPDNETMELMTLFYSELAKTKDIDNSFNKAQKEMRNRFPYEPEKWAGFVLVR